MDTLTSIGVLVVIIFVIVKIVSSSRNSNDNYSPRPKTVMEILEAKFPEINPHLYQKRYRLMNNSESSFFHLALKSVPEGYYVFPKMRIADIIKTKNGNGYYKQRNKILPKHIDFVVCDNNFRPVLVIEIDGKSHDSFERQERDELVDYIFKIVGLPIKRVKVGENFDQVCENMQQFLQSKAS